MYKTLTSLKKLSSSTKTLCSVESILDSVKIGVLPSLNITSQYSDKPSHKRDYFVHKKKEEGTDGERNIDIDYLANRFKMFPDKNTPSLLFDGVPFSQLPICCIRTTPNNTIISVTDYDGKVMRTNSCGLEGYKNAKKGTNIAAQQTAISIGSKTVKSGIKNVRVCIQGLGPGRASSIKGLEMSGLNIISVTDVTRISWNPPRPRKVRRV